MSRLNIEIVRLAVSIFDDRAMTEVVVPLQQSKVSGDEISVTTVRTVNPTISIFCLYETSVFLSHAVTDILSLWDSHLEMKLIKSADPGCPIKELSKTALRIICWLCGIICVSTHPMRFEIFHPRLSRGGDAPVRRSASVRRRKGYVEIKRIFGEFLSPSACWSASLS